MPKGAPGRFEPLELHLGQGSNPLEIAVATADGRPPRGELQSLWSKRHAGRAAPLLCVVLYEHDGTWRTAVCGPAGEDPRVVLDLDVGQTERICTAALAELSRHAATRFLLETLPEDSSELAGLRNAGMFATHYLRSGVPDRPDWQESCVRGQSLLDLCGQVLVEGLGYAIERRDVATSVLRADGAARAIAVFLQDDETPEGAGQRYGGVSPATHALAAADREGLPYAVLTRGRQIRLYAAGSDVGVGRKGRAETYIELNLAVLPGDAAGYLPLIFAGDALKADGSFDQILERSRDFAAGLGERLRDRVYLQAVPALAEAIGKRHEEAEPDLDFLYEQTLVILFRLLFIAYAEDKDLLPYRSSEEYARHALKTTARGIATRLNEHHGGFDPDATDLWSDVCQLVRAVELGNDDWRVPRYGGSLFSSEDEISPAGAAIADLELTNDEIGRVLAALLVDSSQEGDYGPVDFRSLSVREFGTIYEGLLESDLAVAPQDLAVARDGTYVPAGEDDEVEVEVGQIYLHNRSGARKASGSYFTKPFAVEHLLDHALEPALDEHIARLGEMMDAGEEAAAGVAFFDFRCADIAMGSGHFLVAAVDRIEARLSRFLAERPVPAVMAELERLRKAAEEHLGDLAAGSDIEHSSLLRRQIARRCIYGVDRNLVAVELARLAIWIHTFVPGLPLGFLDRTLVCGDSLTGIGTLDEAVAVLDPAAAEDGSAPSLFREQIESLIGRTTEALTRLARASDADAAEVRAAREAVAEAEQAAEPARQLLDLLVAIRLDRADRIAEISEGEVAKASRLAEADALAEELRSLHLPLAFPEVFLRERPGFDCMIGNPPWDEIHLNSDKWWAVRYPGHMALPSVDRKEAVSRYRAQRPDLAQLFDDEVGSRNMSRQVVRAARGFAVSDYFVAFAWRTRDLTRSQGCFGLVLPAGAAVGASNRTWRRMLLDEGNLSAVTHLINTGGWVFDDVHSSYRVVLLAWKRDGHLDHTEIRGLFRSILEWMKPQNHRPLTASAAELQAWTESVTIPALLEPGAADIYRRIQSFPHVGAAERLDGALSAGCDGTARRTTELIRASDPASATVRVIQGRCFRHWTPELKEPIGHIEEHLVPDVPGLHMRILVYRKFGRSDDSRSFIICSLPPSVYVKETAYWINGDLPEGRAYFVLGYFGSRVFDWWVRCVVDLHILPSLFGSFPMPEYDPQSLTHQKLTEVARALVDEGPGDARLAELDAAAADVTGLNSRQVSSLMRSFHPTWQYEEHLRMTLSHLSEPSE